jgi:prefoldin subunit 5
MDEKDRQEPVLEETLASEVVDEGLEQPNITLDAVQQQSESDDDLIAASSEGEGDAAVEAALVSPQIDPESVSKLQILTSSLLKMSENMIHLLEGVKALNGRLNAASGNFEKTLSGYKELVKRKEKQVFIALGSAVAVILVCVATTLLMSISFGKQVTNMNALSLGLSRRIAEVNSGLVTFEEINGSIRALNDSLLSIATGQEQTQQDFQVLKQDLSVSLLEEFASNKVLISEQVNILGGTINSLRDNSGGIADKLSANVKSVERMQGQLNSLAEQLDRLRTFESSIEALITLERENYLEVIRAQSENQATDSAQDQEIKFSRE